MRYKLLLSYDGGCFNGWQKQTLGGKTVQGSVEEILAQLLNGKTRVLGSGRTDAGAHAVGQIAHFDSERVIDGEKFLKGFNAIAPEGLVAKAIFLAPDNFHALSSAVHKTYIYRIWNHPKLSVFQRKYSLWVQQPLDLEKLNDFSSVLLGLHDFRSFQTRGTPVKTTTREITKAEWRRRSGHNIEFRISGNGFLKQMVRNIVGTLLYLDRKGGTKADLEAILAAMDRQAAKATAPAQGLYLLRVDYPETLDNQCRKL
jgi:tRNA pseudouridine38-40 synthase